MKKILFMLICIISIGAVMAVSVVEDKRSKLEELAYKPGIFVRKSFEKIDEFKGMEFSVLKVQDLKDGSYYPGIAISKTVSDGYYSNIERVYIDNDEIETFNSAIDGIIKSVKGNKSKWEILYRSLGGFALGYKYNEVDSKWQAYISSTRYRPEMVIWLTPQEVSTFAKMMEKCINKF